MELNEITPTEQKRLQRVMLDAKAAKYRNQPKTLNLHDIESYLIHYATLTYGDDTYVADLKHCTVISPNRQLRVVIPDVILSDIRLEEI